MTPSLKKVIGNFFPVADLEKYVTKEQADFLGFKRKIPIEDCFAILRELEAKEINLDLNRQIFALYDQLIKRSDDLDKKSFIQIQDWRKTGKLLAQNNTFKEVTRLHCFAMRELNPPANSEYFIKVPSNLKLDDLKTFCQILEIPIVTYDKLEFVSEGEIVEHSLYLELKKKVIFLSTIYAHKNSENQHGVYKNLFNKISETVFFTADNLSLVYRNDENEEIYNSNIKAWYDIENAFYYVGSWNSPLNPIFSKQHSLLLPEIKRI